MDIESQERITPTEALTQLRKHEDLKTRQQRALEYLEKHVAVKDEETLGEMQEELAEMDSFKADHVNKIIEIMPRTEQEVRTLFSKERVKLSDDDIERVLDFTASIGAN